MSLLGSSGFSIAWDQYNSTLSSGLQQFQQRSEFVDMTIAADGHLVRVHQLVIGLASPYLKHVIRSTPTQHPVLFLNNVSHKILGFILEYVYTGETIVPAEDLKSFIATGRALQIKGVEDMIYDQDTNVLPEKEVVRNVQTNIPTFGTKTQSTPVTSLKRNIVGATTDEGNVKKIKPSPKILEQLNLVIPTREPVIREEVSIDNEGDDTETGASHDDIHENDDHGDTVKSTLEPQDVQLKPTLMFCRSNKGGLQVILNRFMYSMVHTYKDGRRRWECVDVKSQKCKAIVITEGETILSRLNNHNHPRHDKKIMRKVNTHGVFASLETADTLDDTNDKPSST